MPSALPTSQRMFRTAGSICPAILVPIDVTLTVAAAVKVPVKRAAMCARLAGSFAELVGV